MIFSGLLIYWAYDPYRSASAQSRCSTFFRTGFITSPALARVLRWAWRCISPLPGSSPSTASRTCFIRSFSGEWRELLPDRYSFREALQVVKHDAGFKVPLPPQGRYNAAQRITYSAIVIMGGLSLLTGLAIYKPAQLHWLTASLGGYEWARWEHFWLTMGYVGFFVIHIAQVIRAGWANFRAMVCGYDLVKVPDGEKYMATDRKFR